VAYRADIEIAVRGARELKALQNEITRTSDKISLLDGELRAVANQLPRSFSNLNRIVAEAAENFNKVALGTDEAVTAARDYIRATDELNAGLRERAGLLAEVAANERKIRLAQSGIRETTQYAGPIGPGQASAVGTLAGQKSPVAERVQRTIQAKRDEADLQAALLRLEQKSADTLNEKLQLQQNLVQGTREVLELLAQQEQKARFLAGKSGTMMQGPLPPLAQAGAMGFPVALSQTAAERESLALNAKKQQILERMAATRQQLSGLAANLQRLEQNSVVAIADAGRAQERLNDAKEQAVKLAERELTISKQGALISGRFSPVGGAENIPGSPAAIRAQTRRRREALSNAVIGGAFPLLFGQGAGAALGGGLGGAAGGLAGGQFGFGLSLVGTALGTTFDQFVQGAIDAGKALQDPITNFKKLADAGLIASGSQKQYIERLIEAGRVTEAATAIQDELIKKIGVEGVRDLQSAGAASDKLNKALAEFSFQAQAAIAGPLAGLLSWLADVVAVGNRVNREAASQTDIMQGLSAPDRRALQRKEQLILQGANLFNEAQKRQQVAQLYQSYAGRAQIQRPGMSVDTTPELQARGQTQELAAQVQLEAQKLSLIGMSAEKDAQAYAVIAKRIAQQEYENKLLEIKNSWIGKAFDAERNLLLIRQANLQFAGKLKEIEVELSRASAKAAEDAERQYITRLQAEAALYKQAEQNLLFQVKIGQYVDDQRGGADALLKNYGAIYEQRLAAFNTEREIALIEAARNGTTQQTVQLYTYKLQLLNAEAGLEQAISQLVLDRLELEKKVNLERSRVDAAQPFVELRREQELQLTASQSYLRLVMEGILPAEAERIVNFERLVAQQLQYNADQIKAVETQIVLTEATITEAQARGAAVDKLKEQLDVLKEQRAVIEGQAAQGPGEGPTDAQRAADALAQVREELNQLADPINAAVTGANAIGSAFSQAFQGIATGTMTAQEALSNFFKSIGEAFVSMAAEIIAKQLVMITLQTILKALGAVPGGGGGSGGGISDIGNWQQYAFDGPGVPFTPPAAFAEGGFVTGPTRALIGEGGEPEYVIPQSKMSAAMSRYSRGARGESVIPSSGTSTESAGGTAVATAPIDVRYSVERINQVDYVTADQFQAGMRQAAQQGARQGEQLAIRRLQQSASTRNRVGI